MPTLYFGGSFNPIHHGHLVCARAALEKLPYNRIALVPNFQPPHKLLSANMAAASDRLAMCQMAVEGDADFSVTDIEISRGGPSYTIDTVQSLRRGIGPKIPWLIGADMLMYLPRWHKVTELLEETEFIVLARPGWEMDWQALPAAFQHLQARIVEAPMLQIGSTDIRNRVAGGKSIDYLTPPKVCRYIRDHGLYLDGAKS